MIINMNKTIIFRTFDGGVAILSASPNWEGTIEELAARDVPTGCQYKIIDALEIPSDRTFRSAWEYQE